MPPILIEILVLEIIGADTRNTPNSIALMLRICFGQKGCV